MPTYLDIAAVRIQRYLARTPTLRGRRAASAALVEMRSVAADALVDSASARRNEEAGEIDGVISLTVDPPGKVDEVASVVLRALRSRLPGAEFHAISGTGEDYVTAYAREMRPGIVAGRGRADLPTAAEFPLAAPCRVCGVDPAVDSVDLGDDGVREVCADCAERHTRQALAESRTAERRLARRLNLDAAPRGFEDLAAMGARQTRIAVIHADGNRVGRFFLDLAALPADRLPERQTVVRRLSEATFDALAAATMAIRDAGARTLPVIPHVLGGDDVLASVPADRAWRFVRVLLREFGERMNRLVKSLGLAGEITAPTMTAAVLFARHDESFATIVASAEDALTRGKRAGAGRAAWVCFHDLTTEGRRDEGRVVSLAALQTGQTHLDALARAPRSLRENLAAALADGGAGAARAHSHRLGVTASLPFLPPAPPDPAPDGEPPADAEPTGPDDRRVDLDTALRIARWWR
ncbi:hypothetical protein FHR81_003166 [Actinoalloteichus hoggarensis]|uniref:Cas10/Cmr2 second palm domain-containing protein n=1 Tax=Actinoalloteichus hoggarensis TaxID=1470176 RepID=A0A221W6Z6_9PSEU|nr:hypothetical protein [Actinoalloteichus hoggarensis]ASO21524.1 hypothetical protein AHOG_19510 [Actinoalloteichus hoggarensis]MBB5922114.1 hypothetical protein [Actinoalloteichus hoggarensis]